MKLIMAIVQDKDSNRLANEFIDANIRATKLSSTGGFLKAGNSTFIIGIEDERVEEALGLIKKTCQSRKQYVSTPMTLDVSIDGQVPYPLEVEVGGSTVFVLPVEGFHQY
jgi:uncharacterized protein YaaQ